MRSKDEIKQILYSRFANELKARLNLSAPPQLHEGDILKTLLDIFAEQLFRLELEQNRLKFFAQLDNYAGEDLTLKAAEFNITRLPPTNAVGTLLFTQRNPGSGVIPKGTKFTYENKIYTLLDNVPFDGNAGTQYTGTIQCIAPGNDGNLPPQRLTGTIVINNISFDYINPQPIAGGKDGETDDELRARIKTHINAAVSNGTIDYWLNKLLRLTYNGLTILSVNFYEDFLTYSTTCFIDVGLTDYSPYIKSGSETILLVDDITSNIYLSHKCLISGKVYYTDDYYHPDWIQLTPYQHNPTAPWDYVINLATGQIIFNLDTVTQDKLSGKVLTAGAGIKVDYSYYSDIFEYAQQVINNERIIGLNMLVRPVDIKLIDIVIRISLVEIVDLTEFAEQIRSQCVKYVETLYPGQDLVLNRLMGYLFQQFPQLRDIQFISPLTNITARPNEKIRIREITITYG